MGVNKAMVGGIVAAVVIIAVALGVGLGLGLKKHKGSSSDGPYVPPLPPYIPPYNPPHGPSGGSHSSSGSFGSSGSGSGSGSSHHVHPRPSAFDYATVGQTNGQAALTATVVPTSTTDTIRFVVNQSPTIVRPVCPLLSPAAVTKLPAAATVTNPSGPVQLSTAGPSSTPLQNQYSYCVYVQSSATGEVMQSTQAIPINQFGSPLAYNHATGIFSGSLATTTPQAFPALLNGVQEATVVYGSDNTNYTVTIPADLVSTSGLWSVPNLMSNSLLLFPSQ